MSPQPSLTHSSVQTHSHTQGDTHMRMSTRTHPLPHRGKTPSLWILWTSMLWQIQIAISIVHCPETLDHWFKGPRCRGPRWKLIRDLQGMDAPPSSREIPLRSYIPAAIQIRPYLTPQHDNSLSNSDRSGFTLRHDNSLSNSNRSGFTTRAVEEIEWPTPSPQQLEPTRAVEEIVGASNNSIRQTQECRQSFANHPTIIPSTTRTDPNRWGNLLANTIPMNS